MIDVFEGKSLQGLLKDIHDCTLDKRSTIKDIVSDIRKMITSTEDVVCLAPIIKDYLDLLIKNDEHLIKIGTIVQRIISAENYSKGGATVEDLLSEDEKDALIATAKDDLEKELEKLNEKSKDIIITRGK